MTTKYKIILGFTLMIVFQAVLAVIGYSSLQRASTGFDEYRRLARFNVVLSDISLKVEAIVSSTFALTTTDELKFIERAAKANKEAETLIKEAEQYIALPERKKILDNVTNTGGSLYSHALNVEKRLSDIISRYEKTINPQAENIEAALGDLDRFAERYETEDFQSSVSDLFTLWNDARYNIGIFYQARQDEDGKACLKGLADMMQTLKKLEPRIRPGNGGDIFNKLLASTTSLQTAMQEMAQDCSSYMASLDSIITLNDELDSHLGELSRTVDSDMRAQGDYMFESNQTSQSLTMGVSAGGLLLGALVAVFIIVGLVRVLTEMGRFASAIGVGNFGYQVQIKEKGEIGQMVQTMVHIPEVLRNILGEYNRLEIAIEAGDLATEGDSKAFDGDFATLITGTNNILSRFRMVLDNIPTPVLTLNSDLKAVYLNTEAIHTVGDRFQGKGSAELFQLGDGETEQSGLRQAIQTKHSVTKETTARNSSGNDMDISYTTIPMYNSQNQLVSILQLVTDLTSIKQTQRTIQNVASQAAGISNRVAAAAEQLSAQVEQVSRGAEIQRSRVESTASAMTEMNATVLEVANNAGQASEQSEMTRTQAEHGADLVRQVVEAINTVSTISQSMQTNMHELGTQAENIGGVMSVISDIADQTNLLALNAAIEAARAGEAGRGFAVVADSVRQLAEKTMSATQEVGSSITAIQQSTRVNIQAMDNASHAVNDATELAGSSGDALAEIVHLASNNSAVVSSIATAAEQQSATSEEINQAIAEINTIVGESSEGMIQASAAVQELSRMAQELNTLMDELK